jgi:hypothetical protein
MSKVQKNNLTQYNAPSSETFKLRLRSLDYFSFNVYIAMTQFQFSMTPRPLKNKIRTAITARW